MQKYAVHKIESLYNELAEDETEEQAEADAALAERAAAAELAAAQEALRVAREAAIREGDMLWPPVGDGSDTTLPQKSAAKAEFESLTAYRAYHESAVAAAAVAAAAESVGSVRNATSSSSSSLAHDEGATACLHRVDEPT